MCVFAALSRLVCANMSVIVLSCTRRCVQSPCMASGVCWECVKRQPMAGGQAARPIWDKSLWCCPRGNMSRHPPLWMAQRSINKKWLNSTEKNRPVLLVLLSKPFSLQLPLASYYFETPDALFCLLPLGFVRIVEEITSLYTIEAVQKVGFNAAPIIQVVTKRGRGCCHVFNIKGKVCVLFTAHITW